MQFFSDIFQNFPHFCLFSTFHPLVIHLPVILIPFSLFLFILSIKFKKYDFEITANISLIFGTLGAFLATFFFHPHDLILTEKTSEILKMHDYFAYATLTFAALSCISLFIESKFFRFINFKIKLYIPLALILFSTVSVLITGHYGASLSHVYDVKYIEKNDHC